MTILISLEHITKRFGSITALNDVSLEIESGVTGLLGPNGSGKSTLIKALLGLLKIDQGTGHVFGNAVGAAARKIRASVGYMPEDDCYVAGLSGVDMMCFSARLAGLPAIEAMRRSHEILDFCGIEQERYRHVETYSTGMRQKLKFAQAIVHDPPLLILDEPTSGLDPEERQAMLSRIRVLAQQFNKSVLLSTHILPDVREVCDCIVIIARGEVRLQQSLGSLAPKHSTRRYVVHVHGSPELLVERWQRDGNPCELSRHGAIAIEVGNEQQLAEFWTCAREVDVAIRSLQPATDSLESIFLRAVGETSVERGDL